MSLDNSGTLEPRVNGPLPAYGLDDEDDLLAKFQQWDHDLEQHFDEWRVEAKECYDFVAGRQWTEEEKAALTDGPDGSVRTPVVFNRIAPTVDAVCGAEIQGRQQVQYYPREVGDTGVADVLTQGVDYEMDRCDANEEDSDAFRDCLICGVGVVEIRVEVEAGEVNIVKERVDPIEVLFDPSSRKACFADARYLRREKRMSLDEFEDLYPDEDSIHGDETEPKKPVIVDPRIRYKNGIEGDSDDEDVTVCEWQWKERVRSYLVPHPQTGQLIPLSQEDHDDLIGDDSSIPSQKIESWKYRRAFVSGQRILSVEDMEVTKDGKTVDSFSYIARTGKRDRNKGWWYGLVRPMLDPQRFANKYFTQILHIINANAKGGVMLEEGAVEDQTQFEKSWAKTDIPTVVKDGSLAGPNGPRIQNKPATPYPQGSDRMMQVSIEAIRDVTGVNQEILGLADRQQPGILEHQRKQAAYGILSAFFDSDRRSLKIQGRRILRLMQLYLPPDRLVRIVGPSGSPQYVPLALNPDQTEYDVSVDEAPAGPNQKERTFQLLSQMLPLLQNANLSADIWADIVQYSPLPASLAQKISKGLMDQQAAEAQKAPQQEQLQLAGAQADIQEKQASAAHHAAQAQVLTADAQNKGGESDAKAMLDRSTAAKNMAEIVEKMLTPHEDATNV